MNYYVFYWIIVVCVFIKGFYIILEIKYYIGKILYNYFKLGMIII